MEPPIIERIRHVLEPVLLFAADGIAKNKPSAQIRGSVSRKVAKPFDRVVALQLCESLLLCVKKNPRQLSRKVARATKPQ